MSGVAVAATDAPSSAPASGAAAGADCAVTDPVVRAELEALRTEFFEAHQAWFDEYGDDRTSDEAQAALQKLRDDRLADVQSILDKYGINATAGPHAGEGGDHGFGGMGGGNGVCVSETAASN
jgi:hypothetical protein